MPTLRNGYISFQLCIDSKIGSLITCGFAIIQDEAIKARERKIEDQMESFKKKLV